MQLLENHLACHAHSSAHLALADGGCWRGAGESLFLAPFSLEGEPATHTYPDQLMAEPWALHGTALY